MTPEQMAGMAVFMDSDKARRDDRNYRQLDHDRTVSKVETDQEIQVLVRDNRFHIRLYGDGYADVAGIELDQPFDGGHLIDQTRGSQVDVRTDF